MIAAQTRPKLYLAGPDVFRRNAEARGLALKAHCLNAGFTPLWPLDQEPPETELEPRQMAHRICSLNVKMLQKADAVLANIEPFRGPGMDAGTAWEMGLAWAFGKPVFAYTADTSTYKDRAAFYIDQLPPSESCIAAQFEIENFGLPENLMIACTVRCVEETPEAALAHATSWRQKDWRP